MFFVAWPLNFFGVILIDNSWGLLWAHFNRSLFDAPIRLRHKRYYGKV